MSREDRIKELQRTVKDYVKSERTRIENEVTVLKAILSGRTGGAGIQSNSVSVVQAVAQSDLAAYLNGQ